MFFFHCLPQLFSRRLEEPSVGASWEEHKMRPQQKHTELGTRKEVTESEIVGADYSDQMMVYGWTLEIKLLNSFPFHLCLYWCLSKAEKEFITGRVLKTKFYPGNFTSMSFKVKDTENRKTIKCIMDLLISHFLIVAWHFITLSNLASLLILLSSQPWYELLLQDPATVSAMHSVLLFSLTCSSIEHLCLPFLSRVKFAGLLDNSHSCCRLPHLINTT